MNTINSILNKTIGRNTGSMGNSSTSKLLSMTQEERAKFLKTTHCNFPLNKQKRDY